MAISNKIIYYLAILILGLTDNLISQISDSAITLEPIFIEDDRIELKGISSHPIFKLNKYQIEDFAGNNILDALQFSPGLYIQDYGGLGGMKTVSLRGFSSSNTLILIDGMKLNSTQNGTFNLSKFIIGNISEIEVGRGASSPVYGTNSAAGLVNFITDFTQVDRLNFNISYASFSELQFNGYCAIADTNTNYGAYLNYSQTNGDYTFVSNQFGENIESKRSNGSFSLGSASIFLKSKVDEWNFNIRSIISFSKSGIPGAVLQGRIESGSAKMYESDFILTGTASKSLSNSALLNLAFLSRIGNIEFIEPEAISFGEKGLKSDFMNKDLQLNVNFIQTLENYKIIALLESSFANLNGDMLQPEANSYVNRAVLSFAMDISAYYDNLTPFFAISPQFCIRNDISNNFEPVFMPSLSVNIILKEIPLVMRAGLASSYRLPNFNEMYYLNYGSSDLLPETSTALSFGVDITPVQNLKLQIDLFRSKTMNQITAVPKSPISWSAKNLLRSINQGLEFKVDYSAFNNKLTIGSAYTIQEPTDDSGIPETNGKVIPYMPQELISGYLVYYNSIINSGMRAYYVSHRFALPDNQYESLLEPYSLFNLFVFRSFLLFDTPIVIRFEILNAFDTRYEIIKNYPLPGRSFKISLNFKPI